MATTSIHIKPCKIGSAEEHNRRLKHLDYVRADLTKLNENWTDGKSLSTHLEDIKRRYKATVGQNMQKKATPIREGVIVIKEDTTLRDVRAFARDCEIRWGIRALQISLHKDEGHEHNGEWKPNLHAHIVFDWTDKTTGKSLKLSRQDMVEMQTILANTLQMERGKSSDLKHLDAIQYKNQKETERLNKAISERENLEMGINTAKEVKNVLNELRGVSEQTRADIEDKATPKFKIPFTETEVKAYPWAKPDKDKVIQGLEDWRYAQAVKDSQRIKEIPKLEDMKKLKEENQELRKSLHAMAVSLIDDFVEKTEKGREFVKACLSIDLNNYIKLAKVWLGESVLHRYSRTEENHRGEQVQRDENVYVRKSNKEELGAILVGGHSIEGYRQECNRKEIQKEKHEREEQERRQKQQEERQKQELKYRGFRR